MRRILWCLFLSACAAAQPDAPEPDVVIDLKQGIGPVTFQMEEKDIQKLGPQPYAEHSYFYGQKAWGATWVWPEDPLRRIIAVLADPPDDRPAFLVVQGYGSKYVLPNGIRLGTSLQEVQRRNGRPFSMRGLGRDQAGEVLDWRKGKLARELPRVRLFFRCLEDYPDVLDDQEMARVCVNQSRSDAPVWKKLHMEIWKIQIARPQALGSIPSTRR